MEENASDSAPEATETTVEDRKRKNISATKWKTFVEQKTSEEFLSKSQANAKLAKKNIYHHHLGIGGYQRVIPKWQADKAAMKAAGLPSSAKTTRKYVWFVVARSND